MNQIHVLLKKTSKTHTHTPVELHHSIIQPHTNLSMGVAWVYNYSTEVGLEQIAHEYISEFNCAF